jgi:hypothetical protein
LAQYYNVDAAAFKVIYDYAVEHGYGERVFDSYGVWGIDPEQMTSAWYASGCKPGAKFQAWFKKQLDLMENGSRLDTAPNIVPLRKETYGEYKARVKAIFTLRKLDIFEGNMNKGDLKRLGRLSFATRYLVAKNCLDTEETIKGDPDFRYKVVTHRINWECAAKYARMSKKEKAALLPFKMAWRLLFNRQAP